MSSDLMDTIRHFSTLNPSSHPSCVSASARWSSHLTSGRWKCVEDFYWVQPHAMWDMPPEVFEGMRVGGDACFVKGDANYRRLLGDREWDYVEDR